MKTPVIIPAFNEQKEIARTLNSLPRSRVEPIVAVNGSNDQTAAIAKNFGAKVLEIELAGKLPAIQSAFRELGEQALDPLIILDADTRPITPNRWHDGMVNLLSPNDGKRPAVVAGPILFSGGSIVDSGLRSAIFQARGVRPVASEGARRAGPNIGLHMQNDDVLEDMMALPHLWPGEDKAIVDTVRSHGGEYTQPMSPKLNTLTRRSPSYIPITERLRVTRQQFIDQERAAYAERAAEGSHPYLGPQT